MSRSGGLDKPSTRVCVNHMVMIFQKKQATDMRSFKEQNLAFRGHDETRDFIQRGNFIEIVKWYARKDEKMRNVIGDNAPRNNQMTSSNIQKELFSSCASQVTLAMLTELGDSKFSLLVDEARDYSVKEQM
ncbi:uncharacterized protein LOC126661539 [Mercurialis annua]|uniref:uncharacterized protein LOC126661539 n=1 Tax=Mercurialis annua TaxID=3986 RepID=UPI00215E637A|nr:uncharacterized protein LOC126661539 [Mercurialis annua]